MESKLARAAVLCIALSISGCFYPPLTAPPTAAQNQIKLDVPYDLAWDAVNSVIKQNNYKVRAQDPNHGIIEAQGTSFTSQQADCGVVSSLGGKSMVDPTVASSAEYNFHLKADGPEAAIVAVDATFVAPLDLPFHPPQDTVCVSRGVDEARLLKEVQKQAPAQHRPAYRGTFR